MTTPLLCLLGFTAWTIALVLLVIGSRTAAIVSGKSTVLDFTAGVPHGGERYWRINRAHMNCVEYLPVFGALVLIATLAGVPAEEITLASQLILGSRIVQSSVHIASGSAMAINLRAGMLLVQLVGFVMIGLELLGAAA